MEQLLKSDSHKKIWNTFFILILIGIIILELTNHFPNNVLSYDVYGAYLHLPANFIYDDPFLKDWSWIHEMNQKYYSTPSYYQFWQAETGNQIIKYPLGFAIIYAPFFYLGHMLAPMLGYTQDGFSSPYQWMIILGHCTYLFLGLIMANKVLRYFFNTILSWILLLILLLGTNYFFTTTIMIGMPHGHLFFFYGLILWYTIRWHEKPNLKNSLLLGISIGLASLIRATEIISIFIPLFWNIRSTPDFRLKWNFIKKEGKHILIIASTILLLGSIQLIYHSLASGNFFIDAYNNAGEGFDFLTPHTVDFLFSARKGWLVYTPVFIFTFFGFWTMWKKRNPTFFSLFIFTTLNIYLLSTWTCWWYAESFGQRSLVQSYLVLLIPMGFFIKEMQKTRLFCKISSFSVVFLLVLLNQFQTWQLHKGLIHPSRMTPEAYRLHFLKFKAAPEFEKILLVDKNVPAEDRLKNEMPPLKLVKKLTYVYTGEKWILKRGSTSKNKTPFTPCILDKKNIFSPDIVIPYPNLTDDKNVIFKIEAQVLCRNSLSGIVKDGGGNMLPRLVFKMRHKGKPYYDQYLHIEQLNQFKVNKPISVKHFFYSADVRNMQQDEVQLFAWMAGNGIFQIDNITLSVYEGLR